MTAVALPRPRTRRRGPASGLAGRLMRAASVGLGVLIILLGIIIAPLPGPMGVPVMVVGLILILRTSFTAKRWFLRAVKRYPRVLNPIRRLLRRNPPFAQVFWQQLLRLERLVTAKGHRGAARMRKRAKAAFRARPVWQAA